MSSSLESNLTQQTLTDIQGLQNIEKEMFNNLESALANKSLTSQQQEMLIQKINDNIIYNSIY